MPSLYRTIATPIRFLAPPQASNNPGRMPPPTFRSRPSAATVFHTNNFPTIVTRRGSFGDAGSSGSGLPPGIGISTETGHPHIIASAPGDINPIDAGAQPGAAGWWARQTTDAKIAIGVGGLAAIGLSLKLYLSRKRKRR